MPVYPLLSTEATDKALAKVPGIPVVVMLTSPAYRCPVGL